MGLESTVTEMKYSLEGLTSRFELTEEIISKLKGRLIEMVQSEERRENEGRKMNREFQEKWDIIRYTTIHVMEMPEEKREKNHQENTQGNNG